MTTGLYTLLQLSDSLFPSGGFAHSYGLEGLLAGGARPADHALEPLVAAVWTGQLLRSDGLLGLQAHRAMAAGDLDRVCAADRELLAMKPARELREASVATGRSLLSEASRALAQPALAALQARVATGASPGNYAIAFQACAAASGVAEQDSLTAWGYQTVAQMAAALLRLGVLGHRAATALIARLRPAVEEGGRALRALDPGDVASFAPCLEIASMHHERQYSRLFRS